MSKAVWLPTVTTSSMTERSSTSGTKPAPMPWILCGPGCPPESTGESSGSTAMILSEGRRGFSTWPTPVMVPPVPTPETNTSISPLVSFQISSAVVRRWISGLAGFCELLRDDRVRDLGLELLRACATARLHAAVGRA